jgi:hypothetical protein
MFPVPESNWMGEFALHLAMAHQIGSARGDRAILSAMDIGRDEFFAQFGRAIDQLILGHREDLNRKRKMRASSDPKSRWVDGTPEYSAHICGLRKLFPEARFIHILRDVREVVRSMLNFHRIAGTQLVANEQEAYQYWLRTVTGCVRAEEAYGPKIVRRLPYSALLENAEVAIRSLLEFVSEPYEPKCLEPLARRINTSNVPADFVADDPTTDPAIVDQALKLWVELRDSPQPTEPSQAVADALEVAFQKRVRYTAQLDRAYRDCHRKLEQLERPSS